MKKLILLLFISSISFTSHAQAAYGSALADSLMYLHSIAGNDFKGLNMKEEKNDQGVKWYTVTPLLGADEVSCYEVGSHGLMLHLEYLRSNPLAKKMKKDLIAVFESLTKDGNRHLNRSYEQNVAVEENGRDIFRYMLAFDKEDKSLLDLYIYNTRPVLADEAAYKAVFPTTIVAGNQPQIWEEHDKDSYVRYNGIFEKGELVCGSKTIHGYGSYYDGTWFSEEWMTPASNTASTEVLFYPEGTTQKVYGHIQQKNLKSFTPDQRYHSYAKHAFFGMDPGSPKWLLTSYYEFTMAVAKQEEIRNTTHSSDYVAPANNTSSGSSYSAPAAPVRVMRERSCSACGGHGRVEITDRYGNRTTGFCSACNGTGKVSY